MLMNRTLRGQADQCRRAAPAAVAAQAMAASAHTATVSPRLGTTVGTGNTQGIGRSKGETRRDRIRIFIRLPAAVRTTEDAATSLGETAVAVTTATAITEVAEAAGRTIGAGCLVANATTDLSASKICWIHVRNKVKIKSTSNTMCNS
jgi:hypothetical protein